ncbi:hypothetical protein ABN034_07015 [Actinopolymorpha sp. B11F2]|uniref:hypothetical protein n=1 Tax=Actinopolymorpha sp. B11F2 TaxID=3160862 RepID=UPI0032E42612
MAAANEQMAGRHADEFFAEATLRTASGQVVGTASEWQANRLIFKRLARGSEYVIEMRVRPCGDSGCTNERSSGNRSDEHADCSMKLDVGGDATTVQVLLRAGGEPCAFDKWQRSTLIVDSPARR